MSIDELKSLLMKKHMEVSSTIRQMEEYAEEVSDKDSLKSDVFYSMLLARKNTLKEIIEHLI